MDQQTFADRLEISDLLTRYAHAVDTKDWDTYMTVFTDDATVDYTAAGGEKGTAAEMRTWLENTMAMFEMTQHLISNEDVVIDGDTATVRAMFYNPMKFVDGDKFFCGGWYEHKLVRTADGWRSRELREDFAWTTMGD